MYRGWGFEYISVPGAETWLTQQKHFIGTLVYGERTQGRTDNRRLSIRFINCCHVAIVLVREINLRVVRDRKGGQKFLTWCFHMHVIH